MGFIYETTQDTASQAIQIENMYPGIVPRHAESYIAGAARGKLDVRALGNRGGSSGLQPSSQRAHDGGMRDGIVDFS